MQKGANFTIVSPKPLAGLKQKIFRNRRKAVCILNVCFLTNFLVTNSRLRRSSNTDILCEEHVKL